MGVHKGHVILMKFSNGFPATYNEYHRINDVNTKRMAPVHFRVGQIVNSLVPKRAKNL